MSGPQSPAESPKLCYNRGMLAEIVRYLTVPASRHARELGYLKESIAFEARAQRHWRLWESHFQNCQKLIWTRSLAMPAGSSIWVIGSGSLYETPWKTLTELGLKLNLVDLFHPPRIKKIAQLNSLLALHELDVTGFENLSRLQKILLKSPVPPALPVQKGDLVISCNILSQLPILPLEFLTRNTLINEDEKIQWAKNIQKQHWDWLESMGCDVLLLSDFEIHLFEKNAQLMEIQQQPFRPSVEKILAWDWNWSNQCVRKVEAYFISRKT
jgi:hypothetical protein